MVMEVTGQLIEPILEPCPGRDDLTRLKDDQCKPVKCTRLPDWTGKDCCLFWKGSPNVWDTNVVHVDQVNPEKFKYDMYRYQVFARPSGIGQDHYSAAQPIPDKHYVAPTTDIRGLRQTMYIPVLPHNPGGVTEYTFPMTPQTMNEPDVTTACCVPVIPCNPGFHNLTPNVRPDPSYMCQTYNRCNEPMQIGPRRAKMSSNIAGTNTRAGCPVNPHAMSGPGVDYMDPPSHQNFPVPYPPQIHPPHFTDNMQDNQGCMVSNMHGLGMDAMDDGMNAQSGQGAAFTSLKSVRYRDRVERAVRANAEHPIDRIRRLKNMYGAFGSYLVATPYTRRHLEGVRDTITQQGNGFAWSYPQYENRQCYIIERNPRC